MAFTESGAYRSLYTEVAHGERVAHHALDNYGMDMSTELKEALQALEKAYRAVLERMEAEKCIK